MIIIGAGGHAKVVISTLLANNIKITGLLDDNEKSHHTYLMGFPVLGSIDLLADLLPCDVVLAIGDNHTRKQIVEKYPTCNWRTIIHPMSYIDPSSQIGKGTVVFAGAVIQPEAVVGKYCIINTSSTIDHDCVLEDYVHICPGTHLAGNVHIEKGCMLGVNTSVIPEIRIGSWSLVGGGSVVTKNLPAEIMAYGVPATVIKDHRKKYATN